MWNATKFALMALGDDFKPQAKFEVNLKPCLEKEHIDKLLSDFEIFD